VSAGRRGRKKGEVVGGGRKEEGRRRREKGEWEEGRGKEEEGGEGEGIVWRGEGEGEGGRREGGEPHLNNLVFLSSLSLKWVDFINIS
jgi:hypothetical protein